MSRFRGRGKGGGGREGGGQNFAKLWPPELLGSVAWCQCWEVPMAMVTDFF